MTVDDIYNAAVLVQAIIEENDRLREENYQLKQEAEEHRKKCCWMGIAATKDCGRNH